MAERQPTRAEILARIAASSKDSVILREMQRLGFWPRGEDAPTPAAEAIEREAALMRELGQVSQQLAQTADTERALKEQRRAALKAARDKREATAQAREQQRHARALDWHARRAHELPYLGAGASALLNDTEARKGPATADELAQAMGLPLAELRFLAFHREVAKTSHYRRFALPKKTGGQRIISAPMPRLKRAQYWVLDHVLMPEPCHDAAHGFRAGRSIVSNAAPHTQQAVVVNVDLKDFFPSIGFARVRGLFQALGYSGAVATVLALLCTENACDELVVDGEHFFVGGKAHQRVLPQGAPTSPAITNLLCRRLDRRLAGIARQLGFAYTRYADDLSFSAPAADAPVGRLLRQVRHIVADEGFTVHPTKQSVMRAGERQAVTGVVVNHAPAAPRAERRRLRAALHRAQTQGMEAAHWRGEPATAQALAGYAQFAAMLNPRQGAPLLHAAYAVAAPSRFEPDSGFFRRAAADGQPPLRANGQPWWQPAERPAPELAKTQGQIKAERQARLNAERAERAERTQRVPAEAAAAAPSRATRGAPPSAASDAAAPPLPTWRLVVRALLLIYVALRLKSGLVFLLGGLFLAWTIRTRRFGLLTFLLGMVGVIVVSAFVRGLTGF
ncbi:MAG: reverse transcriptase family protein [Pseudomonadota bacterium]|nr:reverse transcriptase family protein [Pseudomonadota bacterium]